MAMVTAKSEDKLGSSGASIRRGVLSAAMQTKTSVATATAEVRSSTQTRKEGFSFANVVVPDIKQLCDRKGYS